MKFGLFKYNTINIGDEVQSLAAKQFLPYVDYYFDRENIDKTAVNEDVKVIMNGWFMHNPENWPFQNKYIKPFLTSFHINHKEMLKSEALDFYKKYESAIGCRDEYTLGLLKADGVDSYFSGCLTLTLKNKFNYRNDGIYIVDVDPKIKKYIPNNITNVQFLSHLVSKKRSMKHDYKFNLAQEYLDKYAKAKLVITSRLHCALPCLAFGTPVVFIPSNLKDFRYKGLLEYLNHCSIDDLENGLYNIDFENPKPNPKDISNIRESLIKSCIDFIGYDYYNQVNVLEKTNENKKYLIVKGTAGFGNRIMSFCEAYIYSKILNRELVVDWKDGMYNDLGQDCFLEFFDNKNIKVVKDDNFLLDICNENKAYPDTWLGFENENISNMITLLSKKNNITRTDFVIPAKNDLSFSFDKKYPDEQNLFFYSYGFDDDLYFKIRPYLKNDLVFINKDFLLNYLIKKELPVRKDIDTEIKEITNSFKDKKIIGVHVRYTDNVNKKNLNDFLGKYFNIINTIIAKNDGNHFIFLATDNKKVLNIFQKKYKNLIIHEKYLSDDVDQPIHYDVKCKDKIRMGKDALIEIYVLSNCDYIVGSKKSSFVRTVSVLSDHKKTIKYDIENFNNDFLYTGQGVSIICAVKDRTDNLKKSIKTWLINDEVLEIIIVDWDSKKSVKKSISNLLNDKRIKIVEVKNQPKWVLSKAYNLAAKFVSNDIILKLDADIVLNKDFFKKHLLGPGLFYRGNWYISRDENENHLTGTVFLNKTDFDKVGGYNEFINTYGYDDLDLYNRLSEIDLVGKDFDLNCLYHIPHHDYHRIIHQPSVKNIKEEGLNNWYISKKIVWNNKRTLTRYKIDRVNYSMYTVSEYKTLSFFIRIIRKLSIILRFYKTAVLDFDRFMGLIGICINKTSPKFYNFLIKIFK